MEGAIAACDLRARALSAPAQGAHSRKNEPHRTRLRRPGENVMTAGNAWGKCADSQIFRRDVIPRLTRHCAPK